MNMFKIKRTFYLSIGILTQLLTCYVFKSILFGLLDNTFNNKTPETIAIVLGSILAILVIALIQIIMYGLSYWHREEKSIIFYYFFKTFKRTKIVHHEHLGDFILKLDKNIPTGKELDLYQQNWFGFKRIASFELVDNPEVLAKRIKSKLDEIYSKKLFQTDQEIRLKQKVNKIMEWDGYLDVVTRRDDKLDKLGIK